MALVDYSDSEEEAREATPPLKKRKLSIEKSTLPPLPSTFRDLYSSTVRTSIQDDPTLHGGRKRVTPHTEGNWPTHIYLEWCPDQSEYEKLSSIITAQQNVQDQAFVHATRPANSEAKIHSLLQNDLGVTQPLHISLSRPLVLKTEQKAAFLDRVRAAVSKSSISAFNVIPENLQWHPNEDGTRWFFVTRVAAAQNELFTLLDACNKTAKACDQPLLYEEDEDEPSLWKQSRRTSRQHITNKFHLSLAWSLQPPVKQRSPSPGRQKQKTASSVEIPAELRDLNIRFTDAKIRIGQEVISLPLGVKRRRTSGVLS